VLNLIKHDERSEELVRCLDRLIGDLLYLQEKYHITKNK